MPRPRPAASLAGSQMHGVQLTCAIPGHSWCPNGQHSGLFSNKETGIYTIMPAPVAMRQ
jgi:hypothetical protein